MTSNAVWAVLGSGPKPNPIERVNVIEQLRV